MITKTLIVRNRYVSLQLLKQIVIAGIFLLTTTQCAVHKKQSESGRIEKSAKVVKKSKNARITEAVNYAQQFIGVSYRYGGKTPETGFDCSGFIAYIYRKVGINLSPASYQMAQSGKKVDYGKITKGDLMFFTGSNKNNRVVGHVALVLSNRSGTIRIIHSTSSRGVVIDTYNSSNYWNERFLFAKRVVL